MAPEVINNSYKKGQGYSAKADIWSLGCVVLEMLCGRRPWTGVDQIQALFKVRFEKKKKNHLISSTCFEIESI